MPELSPSGHNENGGPDLWSLIMDLLEVTRDQEARIQILESSAERSAQARRDRRSNLYGNIGAIAAITSAIAALIALLSRAA